jgi:hypothetical protein
MFFGPIGSKLHTSRICGLRGSRLICLEIGEFVSTENKLNRILSRFSAKISPPLRKILSPFAFQIFCFFYPLCIETMQFQVSIP